MSRIRRPSASGSQRAKAGESRSTHSTGLTRQSVQRTTDPPEADGLVSYADNPAHQRAKLATLTPRGRATLDAITYRQIEWASRVASRLSENDLQRALHTLQQVRQAIEAPEIRYTTRRAGTARAHCRAVRNRSRHTRWRTALGLSAMVILAFIPFTLL
jgi:hypothetical protein